MKKQVVGFKNHNHIVERFAERQYVAVQTKQGERFLPRYWENRKEKIAKHLQFKRAADAQAVGKRLQAKAHAREQRRDREGRAYLKQLETQPQIQMIPMLPDQPFVPPMEEIAFEGGHDYALGPGELAWGELSPDTSQAERDRINALRETDFDRYATGEDTSGFTSCMAERDRARMVSDQRQVLSGTPQEV